LANPLLRRIAAAAKAFRAPPVEKRAYSVTTLADADDWLYDAFGATESAAGVRVNRKSALTHSPVWRGVWLVSRDVAKLPLNVILRAENGKEQATDHPAYALLKRRPNPEMSSFYFRQTLQAHALLDGNGRAYIDRLNDGTPIGLYPLLPDTVTTVRVDGVLWYVYEPEGNDPRRIPATDMLDIRGLGLDGLEGYKLTEYGRDSIGLGLAAQHFGARYFKNDASPRVLLEHPGKMSPEAAKRLKQGWDSLHQGLDNSHKTAVLEEGMTAKPFSSGARDAQLIETRKFDRGDVANWLNIPAFMLSDDGLTSFASVEVAMQMYLDTGLDPWLVTWEQECAEKLLSEREKAADSHSIEFNREALVRVNYKDKVEGITAAVQGGWMLVDEARDKLSMNPMPGGIGKTRFLPMNMGIQGEDGEIKVIAPPKEPPASDDRSNVARAALERTLRRMLGRLAKQAERVKSLDEWLLTAVDGERKTLIEMIAPDVAVAAALTGRKLAPAQAFAGDVIEMVRTSPDPPSQWPEMAPELAAKLLQTE
jgi:HK97 family phage portal protein